MEKTNPAVEDAVQMTGKEKEPTMWFNGNEYVPFESLSNEELQKALLRTQKLQLRLHNRMSKFAQIITAIDDDAERRGIILVDYDSDWHKNTRKDKKKPTTQPVDATNQR